jgi:hypothetical protein
MVGLIAGAMAVGPVAAATKSETERISQERIIDHAAVENLQRWVAAGHDDWCKDARLVAAEEMWRLAPDFAEGGLALSAVNDEPEVADADGKDVMTFEWVPRDGRAVYRVTVERFAWLLPIAKDADSMVWVPTRVEIRVHL